MGHLGQIIFATLFINNLKDFAKTDKISEKLNHHMPFLDALIGIAYTGIQNFAAESVITKSRYQ